MDDVLTWEQVEQHCAGRVKEGCGDEMLDVEILPPSSLKIIEATVVPTRMHVPGFYVRNRSNIPTWASWMLRSEDDLAMFKRFVEQGRVRRGS